VDESIFENQAVFMKAKRPKKNQSLARTAIFEYHDSEAHEVCLAGTFNEWHPSASPMVPMGGGRWSKAVVLEPGVYEYLFVVDGHWLPDPGAAVTIPNPFGGINCCVRIS
jgi:1,4-alpha-glucan branching enzyme